jgi:hypothetical protein
MSAGQCWLCGSQAEIQSRGPLNTEQVIDCQVCGRYVIDTSGMTAVQDLHQTLRLNRHLVSGHLREGALRPGWQPPVLTEDSLAAIVAAAPTEVTERLDRLLLNLADKSQPGKSAAIGGRDYPLGYCEDNAEFTFFLDYLRTEGLLSGETLTMKGWARVRDLRRNVIDTTQAFIAMWFDRQMDEPYDKAIKPAINDAGYHPQRIDRKPHANRIDDEIVLEINRSRFLVADATGHRQSVYWEAGYAAGQKKPVIWTCRKDHFKDIHFDTRQYPHLIWETPEELRRLLYNRIGALIGLATPRP